MAALYLSLTDAGLAAVQAASGTDPVTIAELGLTATQFTVAPTLTALPGEFKRIGAIAGTAAAANVTHMTAYDTSSDVWNATGLGLWLADGTLFAVYSSASTIINKAAPAFALIGFDIAFNADLAGSIAFGDPIFTNPPATEEMRGLIELATLAEAQAGTDLQRALTPSRAKASVIPWLGFTPLDQALYTAASVLARLITVDGSGSGIDADMLDGQHLSQVAPAGMVALWPVSRGAIPAGWAIMDGTNGTEDWRDRFVMSAGPTFAAGSTGGSAVHNHGVTVDAAATGLTIGTTTATVNGDGDPPNALTSAVPNDPTHTHTATTANASSLPPYVVAYYIQKL